MWVSQAPSGASSFGADFAEAVSSVLIAVRSSKLTITVAASSLRGHAAVQREDRAGGEPALLAGEKQDAGRDLLRGAESSEQLPRRERLAHGIRIGALAENLVEIRRVDGARRHRVAADTVADVVDGDGAGQRRHRPLGGAIGGAIGDAHRGDEDRKSTRLNSSHVEIS